MITHESIGDYMRREKTVTNCTGNNMCTQCGECCSNLLPMTDKEVSLIRKYVKKHQIKEQVVSNVPFADHVIDLTCPFLDKSKKQEKCTIYSVRPAICRYFVCNHEPFEALKHEDLFQEPRYVVNLRYTFFGGGSR